MVRRLEHAHESFCRTASSGLSAELRASLELAVAGSEQLPYGTAMAETDQDSLLAVLNVKPLDTEVAMLIEMPLALRLVDRLLGGGGKPRDVISDSLTDLEVVIVRSAVQSLVEPLSDLARPRRRALRDRLDADEPDDLPARAAQRTRADAAPRGAPRRPRLPIILCLPYRSVEQIVNKLEHRHYEGQKIDAADAGKVRAAISGVDVELRVEAGAVDMKVSEVLDLNVGDVIRLKRPADKGVVVYAGDVPTYVGTPGRNGNARAVQVRGAWERGR